MKIVSFYIKLPLLRFKDRKEQKPIAFLKQEYTLMCQGGELATVSVE